MYARLGNPVTGSVDVVVIGAGHSGLAMSHFLSGRNIDHVVLERGNIANSWRAERWDSLKLLTPNWLSRLPGYEYSGDDPDGFMSMNEVISFVSDYAAFSRAPVISRTEVLSVRPFANGYRVRTNRGTWQARVVVIASGAFNIPVIPKVSEGVPENVLQISTRDYRNPEQLDKSGVMVVGASATGMQLAEEIQGSGRPVTLAVGEHVRLPRTYRGKDIQYWMHASALLDERFDEIDDIRRARGLPSPQLIGSVERRTLDLNTLSSKGVRLAGRLAGIRNGTAQFSGSLRNVCKLADLKMNRLLDAIDNWIEQAEIASARLPAERFAPTTVADSPPLNVSLKDGEVRTIIWATGFRPDYSWLHIPVLDRKGWIRHEGGVADAPGLYVMGLPFLRRRKSSFIHGAEDDAGDLSAYIANYLDTVASGSTFKMAVGS